MWKQWLHFPRETTSGYQAALLGRASRARQTGLPCPASTPGLPLPRPVRQEESNPSNNGKLAGSSWTPACLSPSP